MCVVSCIAYQEVQRILYYETVIYLTVYTDMNYIDYVTDMSVYSKKSIKTKSLKGAQIRASFLLENTL